jgi:serine/threonine-protein kinase RsbW
VSVDGPRGPEEQIARLVVAADAELLPPVADFVRQTARRLGLTGESAAHLQEAVEVVCRNVVENAFGPDDDGRYDVLVLRRPGQVVVAVEDLGLPGDYERFESGEDSALSEMLRRSFADEIHFLNLGRGGNRVELSKDLPHADVRDHVPEDEHRETAHAPPAADDAQIEIRSMLPEETPALARAVYRSYGYSYDWDDIYYPERVRELQESGLMRSCVAVDDEEIVGHLALTLERPDSPVAEAGQAVVDPRYRGHHLFPKMKTFLADRAREDGIYGLYSEATAVHPYSQKGNLHLGARETGYLLGYIPASVSYKEIGDERAGRRGSVALMYLRTNREPDRVVYPPNPYESVVCRVVEHNGLRRTLAEAEPPELSISRMSVNVRRDHNVAFLRVAEPGADLAELVQARLRELCVHRVDCIYVDLPLSHPATQSVRLDGLGFFFGCVIPEGAGGGGDVLRLQYLNNVEVEPGDVSTASPFGEELLSLIFDQRVDL